MNRRQCRARIFGGGILLAAVLLLALPRAHAVEEAPAGNDTAAAGAITPVTATKGGISFGACHFQKTPPYEPRVRLECASGEVVVAVFEDGIRCCQLELK